MKKIGFFLILCTMLLTAVAFAYHGPYIPTNVATIKSQGQDDQRVVMEGQFIRHVHKDVYVFRDTAGDEITVEVDDDCMHQLVMDQSVRAYGEIDIDHGGLEVEIKKIERI